MEQKFRTHLSFQLWQVGNLHKLHPSVLVPDRLHLVAPEGKPSVSNEYILVNLLKEGAGDGLGESQDCGHQLLLGVAAVVHQRLTPHAALLLL